MIPCEYTHALLMKIADDIRAGVDEAVLKKWRQTFLTVPMVFEQHDSESSIWQRARMLRDSGAAAHETTTYSPSQTIWNLIIFKRRHEGTSGKMNVKELYKKYKEGA
eukprot:7201942-Pyramimonas_sp.AAC.1